MIYSEDFQKRFSEQIRILNACMDIQTDPFIVVDHNENLAGCNKALSELLGIDTFGLIPPIEEWFVPDEVNTSFILSLPGTYEGVLKSLKETVSVAVKSEKMILGEEAFSVITFRDVSIVERAKKAERYFQDFKKKFLVNISHEFRTPMNAIIGFTELLKESPLESWQKEYLDLTSRSALSMMRNIENLLELTQIENGALHANPALFNPQEVIEDFAQPFFDQAHAKEIEILFLADPRLPKTMMGDRDKIFSILRNLVQNAIKFTEEGGRVLVEILVRNNDGRTVDVEYAVSDTGIGIEPEKIRTLLRPFASSLEKQRRGVDGLGIGLNLSHKYADMMDSHLLLASSVGKGSRFSFNLVHTIGEMTHQKILVGTRAAIYSQEAHLSAQGALLNKYLGLFGISTKIIHDLIDSGSRGEYDVMFLDMSHLSPATIDALKTKYPEIRFVPIVRTEFENAADEIADAADAVVGLPMMPGSLQSVINVLWNHMPKPEFTHRIHDTNIPQFNETKILVAEDNPINLKLLETVLRNEHFSVVAVDNGQKAVDAYLTEHFDIVLMDVDMPVMDGLTATRLIKEIDKRDGRGYVPVIALTAHALIGDRERIVASGLDAHLAKPIDKHILLTTIDRFLKIARQKEEGIAV